jgi:hypothetical protein
MLRLEVVGLSFLSEHAGEDGVDGVELAGDFEGVGMARAWRYLAMRASEATHSWKLSGNWSGPNGSLECRSQF